MTNRMLVIKLVNSEMCLDCNFGGMAEVIVNGERQKIIRCYRLDCDNWIRGNPETNVVIQEENRNKQKDLKDLEDNENA